MQWVHTGPQTLPNLPGRNHHICSYLQQLTLPIEHACFICLPSVAPVRARSLCVNVIPQKMIQMFARVVRSLSPLIVIDGRNLPGRTCHACHSEVI